MIDLDAAITELPIDELGLLVLEDFAAEKGWNALNCWLSYHNGRDYRHGYALQALQEAISWLLARGLLAPTMNQTADHSVFVTRSGRQAIAAGIEHVRATHRLAQGLHPEIEHRARRQFLLGEYEQAVFVSMKAVEIRVRQLSGLQDGLVGVDLINRAFGKSGVLTDPKAVKGEQEGMRALFAGSYAVFRNPAGHREVEYDDVAEAAEVLPLQAS